ncbi:MAG: type II toxin-antitoxin system YafQ family toxin [Planctomycetota bacterium]|jgi:mRNA interferase YafQ|nr:type II toxin-antitoxin system YafQ family toxin [Planctomycetota bacterium]
MEKSLREVIYNRLFLRDMEKAKRSALCSEEELFPVIAALRADRPLAPRLRDHLLTGDWKHHRECHVRPNLLLIYRKEPGKLHLVRLGSHSEVFR